MTDHSIQLLRPDGMVSSPVFSHVAVIPPRATLVLVGGQNGVDETGAVVSDDVATQTRRALDNLHTALAAAGAAPADLVAITLYLADGADLLTAYGAATGFLGALPTPPLVSAAIVARLAVPGALIEISATAAVLR